MCFKAGGLNDQLKQLVEDWSEEDVSAWLRAQGLEDLVGIFQMNNIDGKELLHLTKESLTGDLKIGKGWAGVMNNTSLIIYKLLHEHLQLSCVSIQSRIGGS